MVKQIIKEAIEQNPIGLKEAVEAELMERLGVALQERGKPKIACLKCDEVSTLAAWEKNGGFCPKFKVSLRKGVAESLQESVKDLGHGIRVNINSDKSMVIGDRSAPGGTQLVVLDTDHVAKMVSVLSRNVLTKNKPVKVTLGKGVIMSLDSDGDAIISDINTPIGRQMVVLTAKQVQEILKLIK